MNERDLHPELEDRLVDLARKIAKLRQKAGRSKGIDRIEGIAEVGRLEHRYAALEQRLSLLKDQRRGLRWNLKEELEELGRELSDAVEELISWTDSDYRLNRRLEPPLE